jgi:pimeloyl-ACP methyl ester carboxylesterase
LRGTDRGGIRHTGREKRWYAREGMKELRLTIGALLLPLAAIAGQTPADPPPALRSLIEGSGRAVVMLGGGVYGAAGFAPHADILARNFTVVRLQTLNIDRAQMGQPLPAEYSLDLESAAMTRALDALSLTGPVDIVGVSFGGLVALDFALEHPGRVRTLTLFEPPAFWAMPAGVLTKSPEMRAMIELTRTFGPTIDPTDAQLAQFQCALGNCGLTPPSAGTPERAVWDARHRTSLRGLAAVPTHRDSPDRLKTFRRPVLIMTGSDTVNFHRLINDTLAALLPMVERAEVAGGHTAPTASRDDFLAKWRAFLTKH